MQRTIGQHQTKLRQTRRNSIAQPAIRSFFDHHDGPLRREELLFFHVIKIGKLLDPSQALLAKPRQQHRQRLVRACFTFAQPRNHLGLARIAE